MMCKFCETCCSCHTNPPCSFCTSHIECEVCGQLVCKDRATIGLNASDGNKIVLCCDCAEFDNYDS